MTTSDNTINDAIASLYDSGDMFAQTATADIDGHTAYIGYRIDKMIECLDVAFEPIS